MYFATFSGMHSATGYVNCSRAHSTNFACERKLDYQEKTHDIRKSVYVLFIFED